MKWTLLLLMLGSLLFSTFAAADTARCIPAADLRQIADDFPQFSALAGREVCDDNSQTWHLLSSLMFLRETRFAPVVRSRDELFSGRFAGNWYGYFAGLIDRFEIVADCPKNVIAFVRMGGERTMFTCPLALTDQLSSLDRASVMLHEARHVDGYPHIDCTRGPRRQLPGACDERISEGGSYAVTVETYAQLSRDAEGLHPAQRAFARASAVYFADEAFEHPVRVERRSEWLLLTSQLDMYLYNAKRGLLKEAGRAQAYGKIIRRGLHMILFPEDRNRPAEFIFANNAGRLAQSPPEFAGEYNLQSPAQRAELVDLHLAPRWHARVYRRHVSMACNPLSAATVDVALPGGAEASGLIYPEGYRREAERTHLLTKSGDVLELSCAGERAAVKKTRMRFDRHYDRLENGAGDVLGLAGQKLYRIEGSRSRELRTGLEGTLIEMLPYQSFEFFDGAE